MELFFAFVFAGKLEGEDGQVEGKQQEAEGQGGDFQYGSGVDVD